MNPLLGKESRTPSVRQFLQMLVPIAAIAICLALHLLLPNIYPEDYVAKTYAPFLEICLAIYAFFFILGCFFPRVRRTLFHLSWLLLAAFFLLEALDIATLKTGYKRLPFVPSPDKMLEVIVANRADLFFHFLGSMRRLFTGIAIGTVLGLVSGVLMGWSKFCNYWLSPVLKIIGPIPAVAWLPIAMVIFPSSYSASLFLIFLAVWFPLTLMVSSSIRNTDKKLIETARVLGAGEWHIMLHVAVPSAMPSMFTGMFMGLSTSFGSLLWAETLGVKAGLGWYINWADAWGEYAKVYSTVALLTVVFSVLITILFRLRDYLMKWQKGSVRW